MLNSSSVLRWLDSELDTRGEARVVRRENSLSFALPYWWPVNTAESIVAKGGRDSGSKDFSLSDLGKGLLK